MTIIQTLVSRMRAGQRAVPARYGALAWIGLAFVAIGSLLRIGLLGFECATAGCSGLRMPLILSIGLFYDLVAVGFAFIPFALLALWTPNGARGRALHGTLVCAFFLFMLFGALFVAVAEVLFWNEFGSRFNFIAVDYLIYTRETIGNIRESYPVGPLLAGVVVATVGLFLALRRPIWTAAAACGGTWRQRFATTTAILTLPMLLPFAFDDAPRNLLASSSTARELASNGFYEFVRAFRSNELDFDAFYATIPEADAKREMRHEFQEAHTTSVFTGGDHPLERMVAGLGPRRPLNVVLVTMESFGAELTESLGGAKGLSPNLDRLGREGMLFTHMYATGTRTVRGLEAISLSMPPTPGLAVLKREHNTGFQTLGGVLKAQGYDPVFIYGGYSYFDGMRGFFGGNGYDVVDRGALTDRDISHQTIWGVADEDLYKLVLREIDTRHGTGKPVFAHVMTTSNHRPFTYPSGRIDIPSGTGRDGAAKYSDWAIGEFMRQAVTRPWFKDTLFVFVADHTSDGRGKTDLPLEKFRIPMIVYAPDHIAPTRIDTVASQIDVAPTLLALLNVSYTSRFFGQDIMTEGQHHPRAVMGNYLTVGHVEDGLMVELSPKRRSRVLDARGHVLPADDPRARRSVAETIAYFQTASDVLKRP